MCTNNSLLLRGALANHNYGKDVLAFIASESRCCS